MALNAVLDVVTTGEHGALSGNVLINNGNGADTGGALSISAVDGVAVSVGAQVTLASGALLTVNADGTFEYDPNGAFDGLVTGESATDSFAYTLSGFDGLGDFPASVELSSLDGSNGFVLNGNGYSASGASVSGAGDINGDGIDDLIIGAPHADPNGPHSGESYVVFGSSAGFASSVELSSLDGSNGFVLNGIDAFDFSGFSVSRAGDVNGDGTDDLIIGAYRAEPNGDQSGESYVVFGRSDGFAARVELSSLDGSTGFVLNGIDAYTASGKSVSGAGDINGDGIDDLIIGAYGADPNGSLSGESYVVFGRAPAGPTLTDSATVTITISGETFTTTISGTAGEGEVLTAEIHGFNAPTGSLAYQWLGDGADISGATAETYTPGQDDVGTAISLRVTYTDAQGAQESVSAPATGPVIPANLTLPGTDGDDLLTGRGGNDMLNGLAGNDTLIGNDGGDTMLGGDGDDRIDGGDGNDDIFGGSGADVILGGFGADTIAGQDGDDVMTGAALGDVLSGNNGDDFINGGYGYDRLNGGTGADRFFHTGHHGHGSDWIQDYNAADGDVLMYGAAADASDFLIQRAATPNAGNTAIQEIFVTHKGTGNLLWALVDGDDQAQINVLAEGQMFDIL